MAHKPRIIPVILAGGEGKRLWPLSTPQRPKQFLPLTGKKSLFQEACLRAQKISDHWMVMTSDAYRFMVAEQLQEIGPMQAMIVLEPESRNTAPAIACAAAMIQQQHPDAAMLVLPSDHHIRQEDGWADAVQQAAKIAASGHHVTFGIKPDSPSTRYGYIGKGKPHSQHKAAFCVEQFHEKPDEDKAARYVQSGYYWNSGMFALSPSVVLEELAQMAPELVAHARSACGLARQDMGFVRLDAASYQHFPSVPIDRALMEKTQRAVMIEGEFFWSDLGSYQSVEALYDHAAAPDGLGFADEMSNVVYSPQRPVYLLGVDHIRVVATDDVTVVMPRDMDAVAESVIEEIQSRHQAVKERAEYRPWGHFQLLFEEAGVKVKRLTIKPFARISLQEHQKRSEHWVVIKGQARITIGDNTRVVEADESVYVPKGCRHRIENTGERELVIIEIQSGEELSETDIVRYEDDYGRHQ